jgi:hypothetical protein
MREKEGVAMITYGIDEVGALFEFDRHRNVIAYFTCPVCRQHRRVNIGDIRPGTSIACPCRQCLILVGEHERSERMRNSLAHFRDTVSKLERFKPVK